VFTTHVIFSQLPFQLLNSLKHLLLILKYINLQYLSSPPSSIKAVPFSQFITDFQTIIAHILLLYHMAFLSVAILIFMLIFHKTSVWLVQLVVTGLFLCVLANACPYRRTVVQLLIRTRPTKPSIVSGSVKLIAVCI
jgi:hypothetical protein